jgi:DNA-directed RNA polymerase specialized sigma24 family protein
MTLLSEPLPLHDVDDVERFARSSANEALRRMGARLGPNDLDDMVAFLIGEAWELSGRYDPDRGASFAKYAYDLLPKRAISWYRKRFRDTRYGTKTHVRIVPWGAELWIEGRRCMKLASRYATTMDAQEAERLFRTAVPDSLEDLTEADAPATSGVEGELLTSINADVLSPQARMTLERIARPHVEQDLSLEEIGVRLGWGRKRVSDLMTDLKLELEAKCQAA